MFHWPHPTVKGFYERLLERKSAATAESYYWSVILFFKFLAEERVTVEMLHVTKPGFLDDFLHFCLKDHTPITSRNRLTGVGQYLRYLRMQGIVVPDYAAPDVPRIEPKEIRVLTLEELDRFFQHVVVFDEPVRTALMLMPLTGLRCEETVKILMTQMRIVDGWVILTFQGKGMKTREVPLLKQGNGVLKAYMTGWRTEHRKRASGNPWLFPGHFIGKHITTRTLRKWASNVSEDLGIPELSPHILRKTYSTMLDAMGVSPLMIAQLLGHSKVDTTRLHYIKHEVGTLIGNLSRIHVPSPILETG